MATHTFHPDTHVYGLADGCPRCDEHAQNPMVGLDSANLAALRHRLAHALPARSENEARAMVNLSEADTEREAKR